MASSPALPVVDTILWASLAGLVLRRARESAAARVFVGMLAPLCLFGLAQFVGRLGVATPAAVEFYRWGNGLSIPFLSAGLLHFALLFPRRAPGGTALHILPYIPALSILTLLLYDIRLYATGAEIGPAGELDMVYGPLLPLFTAVTAAPGVLTLALWFYRALRADLPVERRILRNLIAAFAIPVATGFAWSFNRIFGLPLPFLVLEGGVAATALVAYTILRYRILITPVLEEPGAASPRFPVPAGGGYLIAEPEPAAAFEMLQDLASHGRPGVVFTRAPPGLLRGTYGLQKTPLFWVGLWLERRPPTGYAGAVHRVEDLIHASRDFMEDAPGGVVLVDNIAHLVEHFGFQAVAEMAIMLKEAAVRTGSIFLLRVDPRIAEPAQMVRLEQELARLPDRLRRSTAPSLRDGAVG